MNMQSIEAQSTGKDSRGHLEVLALASGMGILGGMESPPHQQLSSRLFIF